MYAVAYDTGEGYGSVALIGALDGSGPSGTVRLLDPIRGELEVRRDACCHVLWTEGGEVLPFVWPVLAATTESPWLWEQPDLKLAANEPSLQEGYISGYPLAYERVQLWREGLAPDWRTVALVLFFARSTIQTKISVAQAAYAEFGPVLRELLERNEPLSEPQIYQLPRFRSLGLMKERAKAFAVIPEYASWLADELDESAEYSRRFRNRMAQEPMIPGIGLAKLSFSLSLLGRDGACLDAEILKHWYGSVQAADVAQARVTDKTSCHEECFSRMVVQRYASMEDKLRSTRYWDSAWPMPFAKAQWMLWESLVRPDGVEDHSTLWKVLEA